MKLVEIDDVPLAEARVRPLSQGELAAWRREQGCRAMAAHGSYWSTYWGVYQPLHPLAVPHGSRLSRPALLSWAVRAAVDPSKAEPNASIPLHLIEDPASYGEQSLHRTKRKQVRRCLGHVEFFQLRSPRLLHEQGWRVYSSNALRLGRFVGVREHEYHRMVDRMFENPRTVVAAAVADGRLLGYSESYVVDDVAYMHEKFVATEEMSSDVSPTLTYEVARFYGSLGTVRVICAGHHLPEREGLTEFKHRMGIPVVMVPARLWTVPGARMVLKRVRPFAYYRLTGDATVLEDRHNEAQVARSGGGQKC